MYLDYFHMQEEPFALTPDTDFFFASSMHEDALQSLVYGVLQSKGFLILTGEVGTGKTTLTRKLVEELVDRVEVAVVLSPSMSQMGLLDAILRDFGVSHSGDTLDEKLKSFETYLLQCSEDQKSALLIIDEAHALSVESLELLRMLSNLETDKQSILQILLVGQPELETVLEDFRLRSLKQRVQIWKRLRAFNYPEMKSYLEHRLSVAGGAKQLGFKRQALKTLFRYTSGCPRLINQVCDRTLLAAFGQKTRQIGPKIVRQAVTDLNKHSPKRRFQFWRKSCL